LWKLISKLQALFFRGTDLKFYLWKDGSFHSSLIDAYEQGLLTVANINTIGELYIKTIKDAWSGSESSFNEWYFNEADIYQIIE
jgi:hypothetical protein